MNIFSYTPTQLLPYIDWNYFFHAWNIKKSQQQTNEAKQLKEEAILLLKTNDNIQISAIFKLCNARSEGDNLILDNETLPLLRQQHSFDNMPNLCLSDFVSPTKDHVGIFAASVPVDFETNNANDIYTHMLAQTLADRLTEAAASYLHCQVRTKKELWGYSPSETFTPQELNNEPYIGIRPAIGYPSLPDQSVIFVINKLLKLEQINIKLTNNGAMFPHSSVCGLMFSHPASQYFSIGKISEEQLTDYALRCNKPVEEVKKFLIKNIQ